MKKYLLMLFFAFCCFLCISKVNALQYYIENTQMGTGVKYYTSGNVNVNTTIRDNNNDFPIFDLSVVPQYGYVAICSADGSLSSRYIDSAIGTNISNVNVVNSTVGCTIPGVSAYSSTARVVYFTFNINTDFWSCSAQGTSCFWPSNGRLGLTFYQPSSNEYSLVGFGYSNSEPFNFNDTIDPKVKLQEQQNQLQQEQNTLIQEQIENDKVCTTIESTKDNYSVDNSEFNSSGSIISNNNWVISKWYEINTDSTIKVIQDFTTSNRYLVFYKEDKSLLSVINLKDYPVGSYISVPVNAYYLRFPIFKQSNRPQLEIKTCKNGNQATNDTLTDDDVSESSSTGSDFFNNFNTSDHGLTGIITAPLNLITSITSKTCSPLVLPLPFVNENIELPCMSSIYSQYFGSFYDIYKVITFGIVAYWVCVRIFNLVKDFKNPEHDEIEVVDL